MLLALLAMWQARITPVTHGWQTSTAGTPPQLVSLGAPTVLCEAVHRTLVEFHVMFATLRETGVYASKLFNALTYMFAIRGRQRSAADRRV